MAKKLQGNLYINFFYEHNFANSEMLVYSYIFRYVVKISHWATPIMEDVKHLFGNEIKLIFTTRLANPMMKSWIKVLLENKRPDRNQIWVSSLALPYDQKYDYLYEDLNNQMNSLSVGEIVAANYSANIISKCQTLQIELVTKLQKAINFRLLEIKMDFQSCLCL